MIDTAINIRMVASDGPTASIEPSTTALPWVDNSHTTFISDEEAEESDTFIAAVIGVVGSVLVVCVYCWEACCIYQG